jgi:hypothetical protein
MDKLINFLLFQLGWFACVLGGAYGQPWAGTGIALTIVVLHLARLPQPKGEALLLLAAAGIGLVWDSLLVTLGWLDYPSGILVPHTAPMWIVAMWMLFATTLNSSMGWMKAYKKLSVLLGALFGPLAYYAGARLGGVILVEPVAAMAALAVGWAALMPLLLMLTERLAGNASAWPAAGVAASGEESQRHV